MRCRCSLNIPEKINRMFYPGLTRNGQAGIFYALWVFYEKKKEKSGEYFSEIIHEKREVIIQ